MASAHILYRHSTVLIDDDIYYEAWRNYIQALSRVENRIRELDRIDQLPIHYAKLQVASNTRDACQRCHNHKKELLDLME